MTGIGGRTILILSKLRVQDYVSACGCGLRTALMNSLEASRYFDAYCAHTRTSRTCSIVFYLFSHVYALVRWVRVYKALAIVAILQQTLIFTRTVNYKLNALIPFSNTSMASNLRTNISLSTLLDRITSSLATSPLTQNIDLLCDAIEHTARVLRPANRQGTSSQELLELAREYKQYVDMAIEAYDQRQDFGHFYDYIL